MIIGIDFGSTLTKIVLMDDVNIISKDTVERDSDYTEVIKKYDLARVSKIMITGTGASYINGDILNIPTENIDEFRAVSVGGYCLASIDECLVVSLGTGTSFTYMNKDRIEHAGGCGMGSALLNALGRIGSKTDSSSDLIKLAEEGKLENSDLLIKDISKVPVDNMTGNITVANMAKLDKESDISDYAYGVCTLVFQNIGVMAVMAARCYNTKKIILMGTIVRNQIVKDIFNTVGELFGFEFIIPENVSHGVAVGAALHGLDKYMNAYSVYDKDPDDISFHFE